MIAVKQAKELIEKHLPGRQSCVLEISKCNGYILAKDVTSGIDVPTFDNSAMDGYAFLYKPDCNKLNVIGELKAGNFSQASIIQPKEAYRIFTGAAIPQGADTVIPQELVLAGGEGVIEFDINSIKPGANVRKKGTQTREGQVILQKGGVLNPGALALAASVGVDKLEVFRPPSVGIIVTGDELIPPGCKLKPGQIYDSNSVLLIAALDNLGIYPQLVFRAGDNRIELGNQIDSCLQNCDLVLLTGGISVGDYDFVYEMLKSRGVEELFYKIKQRPGKPLFAGVIEDKLIFALPGNPASVASCFIQYVKPVIRHFQGFGNTFEADGQLPLSTDFQKKRGLTFFLKVRAASSGAMVPDGQQSFNLMPFNTSDAFAELDEEAEVVKAGTLVNVYKW